MTIARINSCPVRGNMLIPLSDHKRMITREMVEAIGITYHARFREDLIQDHFPWFLLSVIFGDRIPETIAVRTFYMLRWEICSPLESIIGRGWEGLVSVLDSGGYTRYDFKAATKLLELSESIRQRFVKQNP